MAWMDKIIDAIKESVVINERVMELTRLVDRLDTDVRDIDRRLVRIETYAEIAQKQIVKK